MHLEYLVKLPLLIMFSKNLKPLLYSGSVDVDEYLTKLNNKLKEQGIDKVINEMQSQLDAWKSNN